jgi:prepilin-type N-terminal cleavage/methylation domain-containing protein
MTGRDQGFTLVELLLVTAILGVIGLAVGNGLYLGIRTTTNAYTKLDQANASRATIRYLTGDIQQASGTMVVNSTSDTTCGGVAPLKLRTRSTASATVLDTTVVYLLSGSDLVRRTCDPSGTSSFTVANRISAFTPSACAAPCNATSLTVTFTTQAGLDVPAQPWSLTAVRRKP